MFGLTEEELIGIYFCVIDSDDSSSDGDEDEGEDEETILRTATKTAIDSERRDWRPVKWTEDSSERYAR
jgi:hypothetical protein